MGLFVSCKKKTTGNAQTYRIMQLLITIPCDESHEKRYVNLSCIMHLLLKYWNCCPIDSPLSYAHITSSLMRISSPLEMISLVYGCIWPIIMLGRNQSMSNIPTHTQLIKSVGCGTSKLKVVSFLVDHPQATAIHLNNQKFYSSAAWYSSHCY